MARGTMDYDSLNGYVESVFVAENNQSMKTSTIREKVEKLGFSGVETRHIRHILEKSKYNTNYCKTEKLGKRPLYQLERLLFVRLTSRPNQCGT